MNAPFAAAPKSGVTVMVADDQDLVLAGISSLLGAMEGVTVIAQARSGEELLSTLSEVHPDLVMTDISMPGLDGITVVDKIRQLYPLIRILVITGHVSGDMVRRALAAGASGYVVKDASPIELEQAVRTVMLGRTYLSSSISLLLAGPTKGTDDDLTERQLEIVKLVAQGLASKQIGLQLGLSSKTVDGHRTRILKRLNLNDIASLTKYAVRKGLVAS